MPLCDFLADMTMFGAEGKRGFQSRTALVCLVLGAGIGAYTFIWAMAGDNVDFTDMDMIPMGDLR